MALPHNFVSDPRASLSIILSLSLPQFFLFVSSPSKSPKTPHKSISWLGVPISLQKTRVWILSLISHSLQLIPGLQLAAGLLDWVRSDLT